MWLSPQRHLTHHENLRRSEKSEVDLSQRPLVFHCRYFVRRFYSDREPDSADSFPAGDSDLVVLPVVLLYVLCDRKVRGQKLSFCRHLLFHSLPNQEKEIGSLAEALQIGTEKQNAVMKA